MSLVLAIGLMARSVTGPMMLSLESEGSLGCRAGDHAGAGVVSAVMVVPKLYWVAMPADLTETQQTGPF